MGKEVASRATMPSRTFSSTELGEAHNKLLKAKAEHESDEELDVQIKET